MANPNFDPRVGENTRFSSENQPEKNGRPKGSKNLATIVRELENENFDWSLVPIKQKDIAQKIGSPWKAIVFTAIAKAYSGDTKAMEWLRKSGYGDKLDLTTSTKLELVIHDDKPADSNTGESEESG